MLVGHTVSCHSGSNFLKVGAFTGNQSMCRDKHVSILFLWMHPWVEGAGFQKGSFVLRGVQYKLWWFTETAFFAGMVYARSLKFFWVAVSFPCR